MTKDKALRMAIEAISILKPDNWVDKILQGKAYSACKDALAETQEPVHTNGDRTMSMKDRNFTSEGNGYIQDNNFDFDAGLRIGGDFVNDERDQYAQMICNALNTTPPSHEWQSLSDAEIEELYGDCSIEYFRDIEAKLRELNDG
jgi:hypothetical protein